MNQGKPTISNFRAILILAIAIFFDLIKILLLFLNGIPAIGTVLDLIASPILSILEDGTEFVLFWLSGAYKGKGSSNIGVMAGTFIAGLVPFVEDFPLTTLTSLWTIWRSRIADKARFAEEAVARAAQEEAQLYEQQVLLQAQEEAAARAEAQREEAIRISIERAA